MGSFSYNLCQWGWYVVLAKTTDKEAIGIFSYAFAIASPVFLFTSLQLRSLYVTDASNKNTFSEYLIIRLLFSFLSVILLSMYAIFLQGDTLIMNAILFITVAKLFESISDILYGAFQKKYRMDIVSGSYLIKGVSSLVLLAIAIIITNNIIIATFAIALGWLLTLLVYDLPKTFKLFKTNQIKILFLELLEKTKTINTKRNKDLILLALPLGGVLGLISLNANLPKYFIINLIGEKYLGIFATISYVVMVGRLIDISLGQTIAPKLAEQLISKNKKRFIQLNLWYGVLGLVICVLSSIVAFYFGDIILSFLYTKEYADYNSVFFILVLGNGMVWTFSFLNHAMVIFRKTRQQLIISIVTTMSLLLVSWALIPSKGLIGAAYAILITNLIPVPFRMIIFYKSFCNYFGGI